MKNNDLFDGVVDDSRKEIARLEAEIEARQAKLAALQAELAEAHQVLVGLEAKV